MKKFFLSLSLPVLLCAIACAGQGASERAANGNAAGNTSSAASGSADPAAQSSSDRGESKLSFNGANVRVEYGRPVLGSRNVESLVRPGMEWRMGSNAATTLTTDSALKFGDTTVPAGTYVLKAKLDDSQKWWLIIEKDESAVATVPMETGEGRQLGQPDDDRPGKERQRRKARFEVGHHGPRNRLSKGVTAGLAAGGIS